ncbi:WD40 repeat-like protein, partial [Rozella allomycis CSF55]
YIDVVDTKNVVRKLKAHKAGVTCIDWFKDTKYMISSCRNGQVYLWDVVSQQAQLVFEESGKVLVAARFHPHDKNMCLVIPMNSSPLIIKNGISKEIIRVFDAEFSDASFMNDGAMLVYGDSSGKLLLLDIENDKLICEAENFASPIYQIVVKQKYCLFACKNRNVIVNYADRSVRMYTIDFVSGTINLIHKLQDLVDRPLWSRIAFSGDEEYILGGTNNKSIHNIYVWSKHSGTLFKMLEGPREGLIDLNFHPYRPIIASLSAYGVIFLWKGSIDENWSAYASNFQELQDNEEYEEREDEFDIVH